MFIINILIALAAIYLGIYVFYDCFLLVAHFLIKPESKEASNRRTRFAIIIPAHNEELLIERLLKSIRGLDYSNELFSAIVVADNCTDNTASLARDMDAVVLERHDTELAGKGYALKWGIEHTDMGAFDAVFVIDADSVVEASLLSILSREIEAGQRVIQCYNGVGNPYKSWFTRLLNVSRTIGNEILYPAKHNLGLSVNLMGNGMCFTGDILEKYGWDAFTIGEDWEYYARLVMEGVHVGFSRDARVYHQESSTLKQATSQRMRWSTGRFEVIRKYGISMLLRGFLALDMKKIDASFPLILPNPSLGLNMTVIFFFVSLLVPSQYKWLFVLCFAILILLQLAIFITGVAYTKQRFKSFMALFIAPMFLVWKMGIDIMSALGIGKKGWVRTERKL